MKGTIRKRMIEERDKMKPEKVKELSHIITEKLKCLNLWENINTVALYWPIRNEVDPRELYPWLKEKNKRVYLPKIAGSQLLFGVYEEDLETGKFGIKEPKEATVKAKEIDLFIVPGVAFDYHGYRIGFGKGFYDRIIAKSLPYQCFIGVCFQFQILYKLPTDPWDQKVHVIVSEQSLIFTPTKFSMEVV